MARAARKSEAAPETNSDFEELCQMLDDEVLTLLQQVAFLKIEVPPIIDKYPPAYAFLFERSLAFED